MQIILIIIALQPSPIRELGAVLFTGLGIGAAGDRVRISSLCWHVKTSLWKENKIVISFNAVSVRPNLILRVCKCCIMMNSNSLFFLRPSFPVDGRAAALDPPVAALQGRTEEEQGI